MRQTQVARIVKVEVGHRVVVREFTGRRRFPGKASDASPQKCSQLEVW